MHEPAANLAELSDRLVIMLLAGDDPMLEALRAQYAKASFSGHNVTGVGFFTSFTVALGVARVQPLDFDIMDVSLGIEGVKNGGMAILAIRDGAIDYLEVVTHTGALPENPVIRSITYVTDKPRFENGFSQSRTSNLDLLRKSWKG